MPIRPVIPRKQAGRPTTEVGRRREVVSELTIEPSAGLIDAPSVVTALGTAPGSAVTLTLSTVDAAGHSWRSSGSYQVGTDGVLVLPDPGKPWWDMAFTDSAVAPVAFTAPVSSLEYAATVTSNGQSAAAKVTRFWGRDISSTDLSGSGWLLRIFRGADKAVPEGPGVLIVPGSTGLAAAAPTAALLASHGYPSGVLAYMQAESAATITC